MWPVITPPVRPAAQWRDGRARRAEQLRGACGGVVSAGPGRLGGELAAVLRRHPDDAAAAAAAGSRGLLPDETHTQTLARLSERLFASGEGWLFKITPAHLEALSYLEREVASGQAPHCIVVGGEQLPSATLRRWKGELLPQASFVNEYGPTETVVGCSVWTLATEEQLPQLAGSATPIGRPIGNTRLYVLGANQQLQPLGSVGEPTSAARVSLAAT